MGFGTLCSDLGHDLKSSWRFKIAALLWIPFFIVICVGVSKFDIKMQSSARVPGWRVAINHEQAINYPQITFEREDALNYFVSSTCYHGNKKLPLVKCADPAYTNQMQCFTVDTTGVAAILNPTPVKEIVCNFTLGDIPSNNTVFAVSFPGGWTDEEQIYLTPNDLAVVELSKTTFLPTGTDAIDQWRATVTYRSSIQSANTAKVAFRISAFDIITYTQYVWFDSWQFQGAFGGIVFFYWVWFQLVYRFLKNFLPNDSKLLGTEMPVGAPAVYAPQTNVDVS
eukprot:TRINITY_DN22697_c0_g1_i1.p1 TRINITY_DN22697_c0_g1~~TRINITY_DN22697_c0_g1_i1.p1  ORF type:complete len:282 (-),score=74.64 TRINITY_DN22697_c0_g1_i1:398-1243(-)